MRKKLIDNSIRVIKSTKLEERETGLMALIEKINDRNLAINNIHYLSLKNLCEEEAIFLYDKDEESKYKFKTMGRRTSQNIMYYIIDQSIKGFFPLGPYKRYFSINVTK